MNAVVETLLTALALSASAACCLALLPQAPPRLRFAVAAAGLTAWLVPWGVLRSALPAAGFAVPLAETLHAAARWGTLPIGPRLDLAALLAYALAAAAALGLALFLRDYLALRRSVRSWRAASRPAYHLRALLPPELARIPAEIRIVANSDIAAASGCRKPTVWIGDRYAGEQLRLILVHELCHVRGRDPLWLLALVAVRRAYWWNPLVAHLARQALLMLEATCDHRSAAHFDKRRYVGELASLVLASAAPAPRMIATMHAANLDVQRLRLLGTTLRVRARDVVVLTAFGVSAAALAAANAIDVEAAHRLAASATSAITASTAFAATQAAVDTPLIDDLLGSNEYTPQQYAGELE
jgi:hypothetical protein